MSLFLRGSNLGHETLGLIFLECYTVIVEDLYNQEVLIEVLKSYNDTSSHYILFIPKKYLQMQ